MLRMRAMTPLLAKDTGKAIETVEKRLDNVVKAQVKP